MTSLVITGIPEGADADALLFELSIRKENLTNYEISNGIGQLTLDNDLLADRILEQDGLSFEGSKLSIKRVGGRDSDSMAGSDFEILPGEFHIKLQAASLPAKAAYPSDDPFNLLMNGTVLGGTILATLGLMVLSSIF